MFETEFAFCISTCRFRLFWLCIRCIALSHSSLKHKEAIMVSDNKYRNTVKQKNENTYYIDIIIFCITDKCKFLSFFINNTFYYKIG